MSRWARFIWLGGGLLACSAEGFLPLDVPTTADLRAVSVPVAGEARQALIAGEDGTILELDGTAVTDTSTDADPGPRAFNLYGAAWPGPRFVAGDGGALLVRDGTDYIFDDAPPGPRLWTIVMPSASELLAAGEGGRVLTRDPDGPGWIPVDVGAPRAARITGGWGVDTRVVLTSDQGVIFERSQGLWAAQTVRTETSTVPLPLFDAWAASLTSDLFAVGLGGAIFRRSPVDLTWVSEPSPTTQDLYALFGTAPDRVFAVGANGTVLRYDGESWRPSPSGTSQDLFAIDGTPDGRWTVAVGRRGTVVILEEE